MAGQGGAVGEDAPFDSVLRSFEIVQIWTSGRIRPGLLRMMDALSDVLTHVRLKQARWACFLAGSPWSVSFAQDPACVRFLYVAHGEIWLTVEDDAPVRLTRGMLAVLPHGQRFVIGDSVNRKSIRFEEFARSTHHITCGGGMPSEANIVYGAFEIEDTTPLLASLPPLVQIREPLPSFSQNLEFISRELDSHRPGANVVLTRMADVIFVQMLRACVETLPDGIFAALRDKHVATALGLVHQRPEDPWTTSSGAKTHPRRKPRLRQRLRQPSGRRADH